MKIEITKINPKEYKDTYDVPYVKRNSSYEKEDNPFKFQVEAIIKTLGEIKNTIDIPFLIDQNFCLIQEGQQFFEELEKGIKNKKIPFRKIYLSKYFCEDTIEKGPIVFEVTL